MGYITPPLCLQGISQQKPASKGSGFLACLFYKPLSAFGAGYLNFAFSFGNAQGVLAGGAAEKFKILSVFKLGSFALTLIFKRTPEAEKTVVFRSPFRYVSGQKAKQSIDK